VSWLGGVAVLLFVGGFLPLVSGVILAVIAGTMRRRTAVTGAAPPLSCAAVRAGQDRGAAIRVQGRTVPGPDGLLRAPLSGAACVSWRHEIDYEYFQATPDGQSMRGSKGTVWRSVSGPYLMADDTGAVLIDPMLPEDRLGGLYDQVFEEEYVASDDPSWCHRGALGYLLRTGELPADVIRPPRSPTTWSNYYTLKERVIPAGRAVFAHGAVRGELGGVPVVAGNGVAHARVDSGQLVQPERRAAGRGLGCAGVLIATGFVMFGLALGLILLAGRMT
jgi:hypothetical protein